MKRFVGLCVAIVFLATSLLAQSAPFKISVEDHYNRIYDIRYPIIHIVSVEDNLIIKNVLVNKCHCKLLSGHPISNLFPQKLQYSEEVDITLSSSCNILRVDVETNKDTWSVEY